jgi:hypothetical protein
MPMAKRISSAETPNEMTLRICRLHRKLEFKAKRTGIAFHLLVAEGCQRFKQFIDRSHK